MDMLDSLSAASSVSSPAVPTPATISVPRESLPSSTSGSRLPAPDPDPDPDPGFSILLIPNAHLSNMGLLPKLELGLGKGCELCMLTSRGVWFPPRPLEGGTPTSLVLMFVVLDGEAVGERREAASSDWIIDSTLSMQMRTFSGLRSVRGH